MRSLLMNAPACFQCKSEAVEFSCQSASIGFFGRSRFATVPWCVQAGRRMELISSRTSSSMDWTSSAPVAEAGGDQGVAIAELGPSRESNSVAASGVSTLSRISNQAG